MYKYEAIFTVILRDLKHTSFMQAADVFEPFKVIGSINNMTVHGQTKKKTPKAIAMNLLKKMGRVPLDEMVLLHLNSLVLEDGSAFVNESIPPYVRSDISVISNGSNFFLLVDFLKGLLKDNFIIEEGETRKINKILPKT